MKRQTYRFSPITTAAELTEAVGYVANATQELSQTVLGEAYPISFLTIFSHYESECECLVELLGELGERSEANNGVKCVPRETIDGVPESVQALRIRQPDPYRTQVGCCDLVVDEYAAFKKRYLGSTQYVRCIERPEYEMLEVFHPDFDVFAYVVSTNLP